MKKLYRVVIDEYDEDDATSAPRRTGRRTRAVAQHYPAALLRCPSSSRTWTRTTEEREYVDFLQSPHSRVAVEVGDGLHRWRGDHEIAYDPKFDAERFPSP